MGRPPALGSSRLPETSYRAELLLLVPPRALPEQSRNIQSAVDIRV